MELGRFSVSLAVQDLTASRAFYEKLSFKAIDGKPEEGWLIMAHGDTIIGLFEGMFERNILTFNPSDARAVQAELKAKGIPLIEEAAAGEGPTHVTLVDPDGNPILFDQHAEDYESQAPE